MTFNAEQYKQIASAIHALPDSDQKATLVQILVCNFVVSDPHFIPIRFIQLCYVKFPAMQVLGPCVEPSMQKGFVI